MNTSLEETTDSDFTIDDELDDLGTFSDMGFWGDKGESAPEQGNALAPRSSSASPIGKPSQWDNAGDNFLSALLLEQSVGVVRNETLKRMTNAVSRSRHGSIRYAKKGSSIASSSVDGPRGDDEPPDASAGALDLRIEASETFAVGGTRDGASTRSRRKLAQLLEGWIESASNAENVARVKQMKELVAHHTATAEAFFATSSPAEMALTATTSSTRSGESNVKSSSSLTVVGAAYLLLEAVLGLPQVAASDTRAAQALEIVLAAAMAATELPPSAQLPSVVSQTFDAILCSSWRPPLTSFFALKAALILLPEGEHQARYCRVVMEQCLHFQSRVLEVALVRVAEEAIDGTLSRPEEWITPSLSVAQYLTSTSMSYDTLVLVVDVLSFTVGSGYAKRFVDAGGIHKLVEALISLEPTYESYPLISRILKLVNPKLLLQASSPLSDRMEPPKVDPLDFPSTTAAAVAALAASTVGREQSMGRSTAASTSEAAGDETPRARSTAVHESFVAFQSTPTSPVNRNAQTATFVERAEIQQGHLRQLLHLVIGLLHRFSDPSLRLSSESSLTLAEKAVRVGGLSPLSDADGGSNGLSASASGVGADVSGKLVEDCGVLVYCCMQLDFHLAKAQSILHQFARRVALWEPFWRSPRALKATISLIQAFVALDHASASQPSPGIGVDALLDPRTTSTAINAAQEFGTPPQVKEETSAARFQELVARSNPSTPSYYRAVMDEAILAILSLSLRTFAHAASPSEQQAVGVAYRILYVICLTEPATSSLLAGCRDDDQPSDNDDEDGGGSAHVDDADSGVPTRPAAVAEVARVSALLPCLLACVAQAVAQDHHRYCVAILLRLCRGSPREFCAQLLGPLPPGTTSTSSNAKDSRQRAPSVPEQPGAALRFLAKKLGLWSPQMLPSALQLLGEVGRYLLSIRSDHPGMAPPGPLGLRGQCEAVVAALQSVMSSYSADPFVVTAACTALGHFSRIPTSSTAGEEEQVNYAIAKYALDHRVVHLLSALAKGPYSSVGKVPTATPREDEAAGNAECSPEPALQTADASIPDDNHTSQLGNVVLTDKVPVGVKAALAYACTAVAIDESAILHISDEGLFPVIREMVDTHQQHHDDVRRASLARSEMALGAKSPSSPRRAVVALIASLLTREERSFIARRFDDMEAVVHAAAAHDAGSDAGGVARKGKGKSFRKALAFLEPRDADESHVRGLSTSHDESFAEAAASSARIVLDAIASKLFLQCISDADEWRRETVSDEQTMRQELWVQHVHALSQLELGLQRKTQHQEKQRRAFEEAERVARSQIETFHLERFLDMLYESRQFAQHRAAVAFHRIRSPTAVSAEYNTPPTSFAAPHPTLRNSVESPLTALAATQTSTNDSSTSSTGLQLERAKLELGLQTSSSLSSVMHSLAATMSAVRELQTQQQELVRELTCLTPRPPSEQPLQPIVPGRPAARPMSAPASRNPRHGASAAALSAARLDDGSESRSLTPRRATQRPSTSLDMGPASGDRQPSTNGDGGYIRNRRPSPRAQDGQRYYARPRGLVLPTALPPPEHPITYCPRGVDRNDIALAMRMSRDSIVSLDFSLVYLGDAGVLDLIPVFAELPHLRCLTLRRNGISAVSLVPLFHEVLLLRQCLEELDLADNLDLTPRAGRDLIAFVKAMPTLRRVNVAGTQLFLSTQQLLQETLAQRLRGA